MRIELLNKPQITDGRCKHFISLCQRTIGISPTAVYVVDVFLLDATFGIPDSALKELFCDPVAQDIWIGSAAWKERNITFDFAVEISFKGGVTDPVAITTRNALSLERNEALPESALVQTAQQVLFTFGHVLNDSQKQALSASLYNPLIQREEVRTYTDLQNGHDFPALYRGVQLTDVQDIEYIPVAEMSDAELVALSKNRLLALTLDEMQQIRQFYQNEAFKLSRQQAGMQMAASDVELEMLAQTWSEHCKHKIFAAHVNYDEGNGKVPELIKGLFKTYIKQTTEDLSAKRPDLRSVFHDNSGVVDFDENTVVCFKVETHNSPSALDPYGGAITGIVGVNRDILGTGIGAEPMFNTNYLCFADPATPASTVPEGLLHPQVVMEGVHEGIIDGGNQSGIPTVAGGFLFDDSYIGKPLVFCGTGGIMPRYIQGKPSWEKSVDPGDFAVMVGGRIGKDGIHGATFSSLALDGDSPSSAVQIGDPITQRKVWDFLVEARDKGLYKGITDNGAGGLSSSLGEMAQSSGGLEVDLSKCPLKYRGLSAWEIWVSESQERMSLAVHKDKLEEFLALSSRRGVESTVIGTFTQSTYVDLQFEGRRVAWLPMSFIHDGLPVMKLQATWIAPEARLKGQKDSLTIQSNISPYDIKELWLKALAHPNVRSKETLVRRYDHEVQARTIIQGFRGKKTDAPVDGAVIRPVRETIQGLSVTHGVCPRIGDDDTYKMALCAVDEAYRSHIALGGDPDRACALDNFCWPDPVLAEGNPDGAYKMAQLVRANKGLQDACKAYNLPLISGKDSMKNDARVGGKKISVRPTLLVSLMGIVPDSRKVPASGCTAPGMHMVAIGPGIAEYGRFKTLTALGGSVLENILQDGTVKLSGLAQVNDLGRAPMPNLKESVAFFHKLALAIRKGLLDSLHDISDGGLAVALMESCFHQRLGAQISLNDSINPLFLFAENPSSYVGSVAVENYRVFCEAVGENNLLLLGMSTEEAVIKLEANYSIGRTSFRLDVEESFACWKKDW